MVQEFHVLRCFSCEVFQVQQVKKVNKWSCKVCGQKQSVIKEFGRGSGADCRRHVQKLNAARGAKMEEDAESRAKMEDTESRAKMEEDAESRAKMEDTESRAKMEEDTESRAKMEDTESRAKMDAQSLWRVKNEDDQLLNKPLSRWDKYLPTAPEEWAEPEETAVTMDRELLGVSKQSVTKNEEDSAPPRKRRRTDRGVSSGRPSLSPPSVSPPRAMSSVSPPRAVSSVSPPRAMSSVSPPRAVSSVSPPRAVSKWSAFLNQPPASGASTSLFQCGEDLDLSWT